MPVTIAVPIEVPAKVTEQLLAVNPQLAVLKEPPVVPAVKVKVTVPVGVIAVAISVSVTVAVHVDAWLMTTVVGLHATLVEVERLLTIIDAAALVGLGL